MASYLEEHHKAQLQAWMNWNEVSYKVIFRGSEHGHTQQAFHTACDNKGPTIVLVKIGKGTLFGGYTSANWDSSNTSVVDNSAFVFQLYPIPKRYPVTAGQNAITKNANSGPIFGTTDLVVYQNGTPPGVTGISSALTAAYPFIATPGNASIQATNALAGMVAPYGLADVEVYQVVPCASTSIPLKSHSSIDFTPLGLSELRERVASWVPGNIETLRVQRGNVLFVGALGSGKSATVNTIITSLSGSSGIRSIAPSRSSSVSVTRKLAGYDLVRLQNLHERPLAHLMLLDSAGWSGASYPGIDLVLQGRIPYNNSVLIGDPALFDPRNPSIVAERDTTFADAVHCVVFVVPYAQLANINAYCRTMAPLLDEITTRGLSTAAVITGCDADESVRHRGLAAIYASDELHNARKTVANELRINSGQVYLLKNYQEESQPSVEVDALALFFVQGIQRQVDNLLDSIALGLVYVNNLPPGPSVSHR